MQQPQLLDVLREWHKGSFLRLEYRKVLKMKKGKPQLYKRVLRTAKPGVAYDNIGVVKEGRQDGTLPAENAGLNGVEWVDYPYCLRNKAGEIQYRFTLTGTKVLETRYEDAEGNAISKETAQEDCYSSEFNFSGEPPVVMNLKQDNIVALCNVPVEEIAKAV
jgi:hypothetical protein